MSKTYIYCLVVIGVFLFVIKPSKQKDINLDNDVYSDDIQEKIKDKYASEGIPSDVPLTPSFTPQSSVTTKPKSYTI